MKQRLIMEMEINFDEIFQAVRGMQTEIPKTASFKLVWVPGMGPGAVKRARATSGGGKPSLGEVMHPVLQVSFELPESEKAELL